MSTTVERPLKRLGTRRYTDEVAAGQPYIFEDEVDGDLDTIYAAVNAGVVAPLMPGAVTTDALADGAVTMPKLGVTATPSRGAAVIDAPIALTDTLTTICQVHFTTAGGLCFLVGTLQLEYDGTNQAAASAELQVRVDDVETETFATPFTAIGQPVTVPSSLFIGFRPAAGPHVLEIHARSAGAAGTVVRAQRSAVGVRELV